MPENEILYLDRGNTIDIVLKSDTVAVDLSNITEIIVMFETNTVFSNNSSAGAIKWQNGSADTDWQTGEVRIDCSSHTILPNRYECPIIVFDSSNVDGILWEYIPIEVKEGS